MSATIEVEIVTPERAVFRGEATHIVLPGEIGEMDVLPGHLPLLTSISVGTMVVHEPNGTREFFIEQGYAEILPDRVSVLTERCEGVDEIDIAKAKAAVEAAELELTKLEDRSKLEEISIDAQTAHQQAVERARKRLLYAEEHDR